MEYLALFPDDLEVKWLLKATDCALDPALLISMVERISMVDN